MPAVQSVVVGGRSFNVDAGEAYGRFWDKLRRGKWRETDTIDFITRHCRPGVVLYDIGAWIGPISLLAGNCGAKVYAFEPDPTAFAALARNVAANAFDITIVNKAVAARTAEPLTLYVKTALGDSETSALPTGEAETLVVDTIALQDLPAPGGLTKVVKVDIEGYEYPLRDALTAFFRDAAALHMSFHPRQLQSRRKAWRETSRFVRELSTLFGVAGPTRWRYQAKAFACCYLQPKIANFHLVFEARA